MAILEMLNTPAAHMVGETLLHSLWQSVLVACSLVGFFWYFKRISARVRYTISFSALCFCLLLPLVTYTALIFQADSAPSQAAQPLTTRSNLSSPTVISQKTFRTSAGDFGAHISSGVLEATPAHENSRSIGWRKSFRQVLPMVVAVWLTGILSLGIRLVLGLQTAHRLRTRFVAPAPTELETAARRLGTTLKVQQPVSLRVSKVVDVPLVVGYLKPLIRDRQVVLGYRELRVAGMSDVVPQAAQAAVCKPDASQEKVATSRRERS